MDDVISQLRQLPYEDLEFARVDHHRSLRKGFPEVISGRGSRLSRWRQSRPPFCGTPTAC